MTDQCTKIFQMYIKKKYTKNLTSFLTFLQEKSKLDTLKIELIRSKIKEFQIKQQFDDQTFLLLYKLMVAVQQNESKVNSMSQKQILQIGGCFEFSSQKQKIHRKIESEIERKQVISIPQPAKISQVKIIKKQQNVQNLKSEQCSKQFKKVKKEQRLENKLQKSIENLTTINQVQNSSGVCVNPFSANNHKGPEYLDMRQTEEDGKQVKIISYEKFSADYVNPIIRYRIQYQKKEVLRRFSDFQKLLNMLRQLYQGCILPRLPPKEGIKAGINYFKGIDETFLDQRKKKLQIMLNKLLNNKFLKQDQLLHKFMTDTNYEVQRSKDNYGSYIKTFSDLVFNAKQIKDYGVAYYNYLRQKEMVKLNPEIKERHDKILRIISVFSVLNTYRKKLNTNFDKRRSLNHQIGFDSRSAKKYKFDQLMDFIEEEFEEENFQLENYKELKFKQSWISELIRQKQGDNQKTIHDLKEEKFQLEKRLKKIQKNLASALQEFQIKKIQNMNQISKDLIEWRSNVHP